MTATFGRSEDAGVPARAPSLDSRPVSGYGAGSARETPWPCEGHIRSMEKAVASHGTGVGAGFKPAPTARYGGTVYFIAKTKRGRCKRFS